jgi:hypothetical protein
MPLAASSTVASTTNTPEVADMASNKQRLSDALDNLADTYDPELGVLEAATDPAAFVDAVSKTLVDLRAVLDRSVRIEPADFDGESGCRFLVGDDHVVAEWRGDGIASDHVVAETPELEYLVTTTPHDRCCRMVLELVHWEVVAAMLRGPGDGELRPMSERLTDEAEEEVELRLELEQTRAALEDTRAEIIGSDYAGEMASLERNHASDQLAEIDDALGNGADEELWPPGLTRAEAIARLVPLRQDQADAASDFPVPLPEPGTDMAKLLTANVLLKGENARLRTTKSAQRVNELERELQQTRHELGLCRQAGKNADKEIQKLDAALDSTNERRRKASDTLEVANERADHWMDRAKAAERASLPLQRYWKAHGLCELCGGSKDVTCPTCHGTGRDDE